MLAAPSGLPTRGHRATLYCGAWLGSGAVGVEAPVVVLYSDDEIDGIGHGRRAGRRAGRSVAGKAEGNGRGLMDAGERNGTGDHVHRGRQRDGDIRRTRRWGEEPEQHRKRR